MCFLYWVEFSVKNGKEGTDKEDIDNRHTKTLAVQMLVSVQLYLMVVGQQPQSLPLGDFTLLAVGDREIVSSRGDTEEKKKKKAMDEK